MNLLGIGQAPKRLLRRHHRDRLNMHAVAVIRLWGLADDFPADALRKEAASRRDHLASCSCWMCGNPRRHLGHRTRQEQRVAHLPLRGGRGRVEDWD